MTANRLSAIAAAGFAASIVFAQDLTQKVSYTTVAVPVDRALREIAAHTKVKMETATAVQGEIVVINVRDVVLNDLMKRIATATSCAWFKTEDGAYKLYRPSEIAKAEEEKEIERRVALIRKAVEDLNKPVKEHPVLDAKTANELVQNSVKRTTNPDGSISEESVHQYDQPANRAVARLLAQVDPRSLATMAEGERVVFSTRPNRLQLAMGSDARDVIDTMVAEQAVWSEAYRRKASENPDKDPLLATVVNRGENNNPIQGTPAKALVSIQLEPLLEGYDIRLELCDAQGKELFDGGDTLNLDTDTWERMEALMKSEPPTDDMEIELSHDSQEILDFFRGFAKWAMGGAGAKDLPEDVVAKLQRPDKFDPLAFIHSEALMAAANAADANLVADVPDSIMAAEDFIMPGQKLTVKGFLKALSSGDIVSIETKDGWMVVRPARPFLERSRRVDRADLAGLIKAAQPRGVIPLDDLATYALRNESPESNEVAQLYAMLFLPGSELMMGPAEARDAWQMLRLYGTLTQSQRQALGDGKSIPFGILLPAQSDLLFRMTYDPDQIGPHLTVHRPQGETPGDAAPARPRGSSDEPTEILPNGLPPDGFISVRIDREAIVRDVPTKRTSLLYFGSVDFTPEELGSEKTMKEQSNQAAALALDLFFPEFAQFQMGTRIVYRFRFNYNPAVSMSKRVQDAVVDPTGPVLTYDRLPADFKKKADDAAAEMKKGNGTPDTSGGEPVKP